MNNTSKVSELDRHLQTEREKLVEAEESGDEDWVRCINARIQELNEERAVRLEAASANVATLRSQISRIRETIHRVLNEVSSLRERITTLFREQGVTVASILTALGLAISTLVLALTGSGSGAAPAPSDGKGLRAWVKKTLQKIEQALARLAGKATSALPGVIGAVVSWLLKTAGAAAVWLSGNPWALVIGVAGLLLIAARGWLSEHTDKRKRR